MYISGAQEEYGYNHNLLVMSVVVIRHSCKQSYYSSNVHNNFYMYTYTTHYTYSFCSGSSKSIRILDESMELTYIHDKNIYLYTRVHIHQISGWLAARPHLYL